MLLDIALYNILVLCTMIPLHQMHFIQLLKQILILLLLRERSSYNACQLGTTYALEPYL